MKVFFDTSVLVPLAIGQHANHTASQNVFHNLGRNQAFCAGHTLAETYSSLTRMPPSERLSAEQAALFIVDLSQRVNVVVLEGPEYAQAVASLAAAGIIGGAVYDGLIAQCALKAKADIIYTWNIRDFQRLGSNIEKRLRVPGA